MITPLFAIIVDDLDDEFIDLEPNRIDLVVSEAEDDLENSLVQERLVRYEGLEDVDDLALYAPIISQKLLQERLDDLVVKDIFVHSGRQVIETFHHSQGDFTVGIFDEAENDRQEPLIHQLSTHNATETDNILR